MTASFFQMGFLSWGFYAWQPYFLSLLGRDVVWVAGVIAGLIALSTMAGNVLVDWAARHCGRRTTLLFSAAGVQTVAAVGVGFAGSFELAVAFLLVVAACMGITGPVQQSYLHQVISSERRATIISFHSMMGSAGSVFGQLGLGYLSRAYSISIGYIVGGLVTVTVLPLLALLRRLREPEDLIVGTARDRGACAAQGLPNVTAVETAARTS